MIGPPITYSRQAFLSDLFSASATKAAEVFCPSFYSLATIPPAELLNTALPLRIAYPQDELNSPPREASPIDLEMKDIRLFLKSYGLSVYMGDILPGEKNANITGEALSLDEQLKALQYLKKEVIKYPPDYFKKCDLSQIRFIRNMYFRGSRENGGYACYPNSICQYIEGTVLLSIEDATVWEHESRASYRDYWQIPFHHEAEHFRSRKTQENQGEKRQQWASLNTKGEDSYNPEIVWWKYSLFIFGPIRTIPLGFLDFYSIRSPEEDKAVIMQALMTYHDEVMDLAREDEVLARKIDFLKLRVNSFTDGQINSDYWNNLAQGKVDERYWDNQSWRARKSR